MIKATAACMQGALDAHSASLNAIYQALGVDAVLSFGTEDVGLRVVDKTAGTELGGGVEVGTIKPAFAVRQREMECVLLLPDDLVGVEIEANGRSWIITTFHHRPGPFGYGEYLLIVRES